MIARLQTPWVAALVGGLLYLVTTTAVLLRAPWSGARQTEGARVPAKPGPSWEFRNPEFDQWLAELKREREAMAARQQELQDWQARLQAERMELAGITQAVAQLQAEMDRNIVRFRAAEVENFKREAKVVAGMSPEGAAAMLREMPDERIVRVLSLMKPDNISAVLDAFSKMGAAEAKRAAVLTDLLRRTMPPGTTAKSG